jgi:hypothetical protein
MRNLAIIRLMRLLGGGDVFLGAVEGLVLSGFAREQDKAGLVGLQAGDVQREGFSGGVLAAVVDGYADCGGEGAGDACFLSCGRMG